MEENNGKYSLSPYKEFYNLQRYFDISEFYIKDHITDENKHDWQKSFELCKESFEYARVEREREILKKTKLEIERQSLLEQLQDFHAQNMRWIAADMEKHFGGKNGSKKNSELVRTPTGGQNG